MKRRPLSLPAAAALLIVGSLGALLAGCGSRSRPANAPPALNDQGGVSVTCLAHQTRTPTAGYIAGPGADTFAELHMLRYYTTNGNKPYCDQRPPDAVDRQWLQLYVQNGAAPAHVQRNLSTP